MKRILLILILLAMVWGLAYALAFTLKENTRDGFRYPPGGRLDTLLYPVFQPVYRLHGMLDAARPRHERDLPTGK